MVNQPNNLEENDKFYAEMDKDKVHQSCCTCQTLMILIVVIIIGTISAFFYIYWQITREKVFSMKIPSILTNNLNQKLDSALNTDNNVELTLTDEELAAIISSGFSLQNFVIRDEQVQLNSGGMLVYGTLVKPFKAKVIMTIMPEIKNGAIFFNVKKISAGKITFPEFINKQVSESFTNSVNNKLSLIYSRMEVLSINLLDKKITINGRIK